MMCLDYDLIGRVAVGAALVAGAGYLTYVVATRV